MKSKFSYLLYLLRLLLLPVFFVGFCVFGELPDNHTLRIITAIFFRNPLL